MDRNPSPILSVGPAVPPSPSRGEGTITAAGIRRSNAALLRRHRRVGDELRNPFVPALDVRPVQRLEFGLGERMRRGPLQQRLRPRLQPRVFPDQADRPDAVEEEIALQERRIGGVDQRIFRAVEQRPRALLLQRALEPLERHRDFRRPHSL